MSEPIYRQIASDYRIRIQTGELVPGDQLPTEFELCAAHNISRHTAREALRLLSEEGLIARKRGIGTVVTDIKAPAFAQSIGDFDRLLQYARDTSLTISTAWKASDDLLLEKGLSGDFMVFMGTRCASKANPVALTQIFIPAQIAPALEIAKTLSGSFSEWLEATHPIAINSVTQRMEAVALTHSQAETLGVLAGSPALRTVRRYRDIDDRIILLSESFHPAGRFAYEMRLKRM